MFMNADNLSSGEYSSAQDHVGRTSFNEAMPVILMLQTSNKWACTGSPVREPNKCIRSFTIRHYFTRKKRTGE